MNLPKFFLRRNGRPKEAAISSFGHLEREVLGQVWELGEANVKQVVQGLEDRIAYTTAMTTLDRLYKKGVLERRKVGKAFVYAAKYSLEELNAGVARQIIGSLLDAGTSGSQPVLACIVDAVSESDSELLDQLEELVRAKRKELEDRE